MSPTDVLELPPPWAPHPRRVRWFIPLVALALSGCGGPDRHPTADFEALPSEGALRAGLLARAARGEATADLAHSIAASYWRTGDLDSTRLFLERAIALDPRHVDSLTWLSRLLYERGAITEGLAVLEPAMRGWADPPPEVRVNRAVLEIARGDLAAADSVLAACVTAHPTYAPAYGNLGYLELKLGRPAEAARRLRLAIALDSTVAEFHNNLGIACREELRFADSVTEFERAVALNPGFAEAHYNLALVYKLYLSDDERARLHFRRFLALGGLPNQEVAELFRREEAKR